MGFLDILRVIVYGIVEGITEWLPISSTGHLILLEEFIPLKQSDAFMEMFDVLIQLGAILAVVVIYFGKLWPFGRGERFFLKKEKWVLWFKILIASIPIGIIGMLFEEKIDAIFYNVPTIIVTLIVYGILFILVEKFVPKKDGLITDCSQLSFMLCFFIGCIQVLSLIPGTSRSGVTIIGALLLGVCRVQAAEFTFYLAIPAMVGASAVKLLDFGLSFTSQELAVLCIGMFSAFIVSLLAIRFLVRYIKNHNFCIFGWYRIALGIVCILVFLVF